MPVATSGLSDAMTSHARLRGSLQGRILSAVRVTVAQDIDWSNLSQSWDITSGIAELVDAGVRQEATLAQSFLSRVYDELGVSAREPSLMIDRSLRAGTTTPLTYRRLSRDVRHLLSEGVPLQIATDQVMSRFEEMLTDDLNLAMREQSRRFFMANERTTLGFRRVIRPELSETGVCGLCAVASDRWYSRDDLMPIHSRCRCDVVPITRDYDPAEMNEVDLRSLYEAAGESTGAGDLLNVKIKIEAHGELGPRIIPAEHRESVAHKAHLRHRVPKGLVNDIEGLASAERRIHDIEAKVSSGTATSYDRARLQQEQKQAEKRRESLRKKNRALEARGRISAERRAA